MRLDSVSKENVEKIIKEKDSTTIELSLLKEKTIQTMWLEELDIFEIEYNKYKNIRENIQLGDIPKQKKKILSIKPKTTIDDCEHDNNNQNIVIKVHKKTKISQK
jgi:hypothetical protein